MAMLQPNDLALVIRPNIEKKQWNGTVDLQAVVMPPDNLTQESLSELVLIVHGLVACFNLMNSDEKFAALVTDELERMADAGELVRIEADVTADNVVRLDQWTKTKGNA
jgi:hypothetical protein